MLRVALRVSQLAHPKLCRGSFRTPSVTMIRRSEGSAGVLPSSVESPTGLRLLCSVADYLGNALGLLRRPFDADVFIKLARKGSGLYHFGDERFVEPLNVLLASYAREADLGVFGRLAVRWEVLRFLTNLLRFREEERNVPAILKEPIGHPLFIMGLPRSGTTFLHRLLAEDPSNLVPRCWQTIYPYPLALKEKSCSDRRFRKVERALRLFETLAPELQRKREKTGKR